MNGLVEGDRMAVYCRHACEPCLAVCAKVGFHGLSIDGGIDGYTVVDGRMAHPTR